MSDFDKKLEELDLSLFKEIHSQTSDNDKRSLLAVQKATREMSQSYVYLEIGSFRGGSLQPHLLDDRCRTIYSLDKRPVEAADARGVSQIYPDNSTAKMLENLARVAPKKLEKVITIDGDVSEIDPARITEKPDLCFIDGEHTDEGTWRDYEFCRKVMKPDGAIIFHDAMIIYNCLDRVTKEIQNSGQSLRAYNIPDVVFVVEIGNFPLHRSDKISEMLANNHIGYLRSLQFTDQYRYFANRKPFRFIRNIKMKLTGRNITK